MLAFLVPATDRKEDQSPAVSAGLSWVKETAMADGQRRQELNEQVRAVIFDDGRSGAITKFVCPACGDANGFFRTKHPIIEPYIRMCKACGWEGSDAECFPTEDYSGDMNMAMRVVEAMAERGWSFGMWSTSMISSVPGPVAGFARSVYPPPFPDGGATAEGRYAYDPVMSVAICLAALRAFEGYTQRKRG